MKTIVRISLVSLLGVLVWSCVIDADEKNEPENDQLTPIVSSFSPIATKVSSRVVITGKNFSNNIEEIRVWVNGVASELLVIDATETMIEVIVPANTNTGIITVEVNGVFGSSTSPLNIIQVPTLSSISRLVVAPGDILEIIGLGFSNILEENIVYFNEYAIIPVNSSQTNLTVVIPDDLMGGENLLSILVGGEFSEQIKVNVVLTPIIRSITPEGGVASGDSVTITGANFSSIPEENLVWFNDTPAIVTSSTRNELIVTVPDGASTGLIRIEVDGGVITTENEFIVASSLIIPLTHSDDDVEEISVATGDYPEGTMDLGSSDLEFGEISSDQGLMSSGLIFKEVLIPQGSIIRKAYIQFTVDNVGSNHVEMTIYGENVDNPLNYTSELFNLTSRIRTNTNAVWNIPPWDTVGDRGEDQRTADLKEIVQEIVDRQGWFAGFNMNFIFINTGLSASATETFGGREVEDYSESKPLETPELVIFYE